MSHFSADQEPVFESEDAEAVDLADAQVDGLSGGRDQPTIESRRGDRTLPIEQTAETPAPSSGLRQIRRRHPRDGRVLVRGPSHPRTIPQSERQNTRCPKKSLTSLEQAVSVNNINNCIGGRLFCGDRARAEAVDSACRVPIFFAQDRFET